MKTEEHLLERAMLHPRIVGADQRRKKRMLPQVSHLMPRSGTWQKTGRYLFLL